MKRTSDITNTQQHNSIAWCKAYLIALGNRVPVSLIHPHENVRQYMVELTREAPTRLIGTAPSISNDHGLGCALLQPTPRQRRLF